MNNTPGLLYKRWQCVNKLRSTTLYSFAKKMAKLKSQNHPNCCRSLFFCSFIFTLISLTASTNSSVFLSTDSGPIVPKTPLVIFLARLQLIALRTFGDENFDPKLYVDLSLKFTLWKTRNAFQRIMQSSNGSISASDFNVFIEKYIKKAGEDMVFAVPPDFVPEPEGFLPAVENPFMRKWALEVHSLWKILTRRVASGVLERPDLHTLLPLSGRFVVPGSRFREVYYWDSYWVIRGLLVSKMYDTAKGIVIDLISLINEFGYVPNGARRYYTNRSQPPLLSAMVCEIFDRTGDMELVNMSLPALLREYRFWNSGKHIVTIRDAKGRIHTLSRYYAMWNKPRPESLIFDKAVALNLSTASKRNHLYRELASAAETGWDFSSRWMRNGYDLKTLTTTSIIPVDLNTFILQMELNIASLANVTGHRAIAARFLKAAEARKRAMNSIFWNAKRGQWLDYWIRNKKTFNNSYKWAASNQNRNVYASNFIPLSVKLFHSDVRLVNKVRRSLKRSGLIREGGITTSLVNSGQQWDFPNGWAPLQHLIVEGLAKSKSKEARSMAKDIVVKWIRTNYVAYKNSNAMHEKYDVEKCGEFGGGGEYLPQTGFGWSNGVVLDFLEVFGWAEDLMTHC